ncbi:MAG: prepilin-type N-terminal cleavage/methylation domain-containing protein [Candidatus Pacebacteria bacterium]|nr:prepilin-type N-terminal cleavage/methylation domain-containing protein [Candidatus Paceibacterota bacterium]
MKLIKTISKLRPMFYGLHSTRRGFTLIELMVSITVIIIISAAFLAGKSKEEEKMALNMSAFTFSQTLREYQEKALSGESIICPSPSNSICGFGARLIDGNDYFTPFVDCSNNCGSSNHRLTGGDLTLPNVKFGSKVKICSVTGGTLDVVFTPPDPAVYFNSAGWSSGEGAINLCLKADTNQIKTINLNHAGKIEIQ